MALATVGDNCIDRYLFPVGQSAVGGNAVNVAMGLVHLGVPCSYFGAVGVDAEGARVRATLARAGVGVGHLHRLKAPTAVTEIGLDATGDRVILREAFGATAAWRLTAGVIAALRALDHVHLGWVKDVAALRAALSGSGVRVSQDLGVSPPAGASEAAPGLDIAFGSAGPDPAAGRAMLARLAARHAVAVVTRGAAGAIASERGSIVDLPARKVRVVDTTGAGDAFIAGFLAARRHTTDLSRAMAAGMRAGAWACTHPAGFPQGLRPVPPP